MANGVRDLTKEAMWRGHVERQPGSGFSIRAYCGNEGLSEPSFYVWRRELAKRDQERSPPLTAEAFSGSSASPVPVSTGGLVAVDVIDSETDGRPVDSARMEVVLPGGIAIRLPADVSEETLGRVLRVAVAQPIVAAADDRGVV